MLSAKTQALAQDQSPPPSTSRGENFSAKPPAQLFASDCTGAGCHKGPQGLGRGKFSGSLASFLREHYTNSRESAAALAGYLSKIPSGPEPREARTPPRPGRPTAAASPVPPSSIPNWGEGAETKPAPNELRPPRPVPGGRATRAAARPDEDPAATPPPPPVAAPPVAEPAPRAQRGRQPAAAAAAPAPPPPPEPEAAPAPPPPPAPKQFDIFD